MVAAEGLQVQVSPQMPRHWPQLLADDPAADYHHSPIWIHSIVDHYPECRAVWLSVTLDDRLVGGLAAIDGRGRWRSRLPFPIHRLDSSIEGTSGGPLVAQDLDPELADRVFLALVDQLRRMRRIPLGQCTISLNNQHEIRFGRLLQNTGCWIRRESPAAVIPLAEGLDHVEMYVIGKNKRNERNRGLRSGAEIRITNDPQLLARYYPIYTSACEVWGVRSTPLGFLQALLTGQGDWPDGVSGGAWLTCILMDDTVVGGHLNLHLGHKVIAWNGVTDPKFAKVCYPATLAVWGDLQEACRRGATELDLGGSGGVVSLKGFKKYFGAEDQSRGYYQVDTSILRLAQQARRWLGGPKSDGTMVDRTGQRWHDQQRRPGGES